VTTTNDLSQVITFRSWWPASVVLPDRTTVLHRCKVYATNVGLVIYNQVPSGQSEEWGALTPDWFAPIDFLATPVPSAGQLPGQSFNITTDQGLVTITYTGGCGCGNPLKRWRPEFSSRIAAWPVSA
jgi:hypothetical protein